MYVLDANIFIQPYNTFYALDLAPGYWKKIGELISNEEICSVKPILKEILAGDDDLAGWVKGNILTGFRDSSDADTVRIYREIISWAMGPNEFKPSAKSGFAEVADPWLIAYAKSKGFEVVTMEVPNPKRKNKIQIPEVCSLFDVKYHNLYQFMRKKGITL